jgi:hypothetical protein
MRDVSAPPLQGRSYGRQLREALDRIEGLVVDGLRHGFFDYSIACEIGKDSKRQLEPLWRPAGFPDADAA